MQIAPLRPGAKTTGTKLQALRQKPQWGTFLPALAAGLAAATLAFLLVRSRTPADAAAASPTVAVVVAAHDLPARTRLTPALLTLRPMPVNDIPEGAAKTPGVFVGEITMAPIGAGSAVTDSAVTAPSAALGMAFSLPPPLRAVTVATDPADGGADLFVRPEDHVDILATDEPGSGPAQARTVLQNVRLLAVGGNTSPDPPAASASSPASGGAAHVTVAVTPAQAQMLVLAAARGHLHLALRAIGDGSETPIPALPAPVVRELPRPRPVPSPERMPKIMPLPPLRVVPLPRPAAAPPAPVSIVIIKGTVSQTVTVAP